MRPREANVVCAAYLFDDFRPFFKMIVMPSFSSFYVVDVTLLGSTMQGLPFSTSKISGRWI